MAAKFPALANGQNLAIEGPNDLKGCKAVVWVKLGGGAVTLTPTCYLQDSSSISLTDGVPIEYSTPGASGTKVTTPIAASGCYEFYLDGKILNLAVSAVTGTPEVHYSIVRA